MIPRPVAPLTTRLAPNMQTRQIDPIIAELRAARDEHAARFNHDVKAIFRDLQARQRASGRKYVRYPVRRIASEPERHEIP